VEISFPEGYPSIAPPTAIFRNIPMGADQITLREHLEEAFVDQVGEPMLYEWVLSMQELLEAEFEAEPIS